MWLDFQTRLAKRRITCVETLIQDLITVYSNQQRDWSWWETVHVFWNKGGTPEGWFPHFVDLRVRSGKWEQRPFGELSEEMGEEVTSYEVMIHSFTGVVESIMSNEMENVNEGSSRTTWHASYGKRTRTDETWHVTSSHNNNINYSNRTKLWSDGSKRVTDRVATKTHGDRVRIQGWGRIQLLACCHLVG